MQRTQIYLTPEESRSLEKLSKKMGIARSAIIRDAIDAHIEKLKKEARTDVIDQLSGIWSDREDAPFASSLRAEWDRNF